MEANRLRYSIDSQQWQHSSPFRWEVNCDCFHWWRCVGHLNANWKTKVQVQQQLPEAVTRDRPQIIFAEKRFSQLRTNNPDGSIFSSSINQLSVKCLDQWKKARWNVDERWMATSSSTDKGLFKGYLTIRNPLLRFWFRWVVTIV